MTISTWETFTAAGKYKLTDAAYSELLHKLQGHYTEMPQELRSDILAFYHDLDAPISTKTNGDDWARVLKELDQLQSVDRTSASYGSRGPLPDDACVHRAAGGSWSVGIPTRER